MDNKILNKFDLSDEEKVFIIESQTHVTADINHSKVISNIYLAKTLESVADKYIKSNKILSDSNNKHAKGMLWLTGGLILVGLIQILVGLTENIS